MTDERTPAQARRWKSAMKAAKNAVIVSWPQALRQARAMNDKQLEAAAQTCTSLSCVRHAAINQVRQERA